MADIYKKFVKFMIGSAETLEDEVSELMSTDNLQIIHVSNLGNSEYSVALSTVESSGEGPSVIIDVTLPEIPTDDHVPSTKLMVDNFTTKTEYLEVTQKIELVDSRITTLEETVVTESDLTGQIKEVIESDSTIYDTIVNQVESNIDINEKLVEAASKIEDFPTEESVLNADNFGETLVALSKITSLFNTSSN